MTFVVDRNRAAVVACALILLAAIIGQGCEQPPSPFPYFDNQNTGEK